MAYAVFESLGSLDGHVGGRVPRRSGRAASIHRICWDLTLSRRAQSSRGNWGMPPARESVMRRPAFAALAADARISARILRAPALVAARPGSWWFVGMKLWWRYKQRQTAVVLVLAFRDPMALCPPFAYGARRSATLEEVKWQAVVAGPTSACPQLQMWSWSDARVISTC